jgi:hypothetical protein
VTTSASADLHEASTFRDGGGVGGNHDVRKGDFELAVKSALRRDVDVPGEQDDKAGGDGTELDE